MLLRAEEEGRELPREAFDELRLGELERLLEAREDEEDGLPDAEERDGEDDRDTVRLGVERALMEGEREIELGRVEERDAVGRVVLRLGMERAVLRLGMGRAVVRLGMGRAVVRVEGVACARV